MIGLLVVLVRQCKFKKYNENETSTKRMKKIKTMIKSKKIATNKLLEKRYSKMLFALILINTLSYSQPNPTSYYIKRVKDITEKLKTDPIETYEVIEVISPNSIKYRKKGECTPRRINKMIKVD